MKKVNEKKALSKKKPNNKGIKKLKLLVTVINKSRSLFYLDLLEQYEINMQMVIYGKGTANLEILDPLGISETDKVIIFSIIREDKEKEILDVLKEKFDRIKKGKGIAYTISLQSIIGVSIYQFLSNNLTIKKEVK